METAFGSLGLITVYLLGTFIHWQTLAVIVIPLPIFALVYGYFIPESPIFLSQLAGYTQIDGDRTSLNNSGFLKSSWHQWKQSSVNTWKLFERRYTIQTSIEILFWDVFCSFLESFYDLRTLGKHN